MCEGKTWKHVGWKQEKKANLCYITKLQECIMVELGNMHVEDKKENKPLLHCQIAKMHDGKTWKNIGWK